MEKAYTLEVEEADQALLQDDFETQHDHRSVSNNSSIAFVRWNWQRTRSKDSAGPSRSATDSRPTRSAVSSKRAMRSTAASDCSRSAMNGSAVNLTGSGLSWRSYVNVSRSSHAISATADPTIPVGA